jgi:hypothetical protein
METMTVRDGVRWRQRAGKIFGAGFLAVGCAWVALHGARVRFYTEGVAQGDLRYVRAVQMESLAVWLMLLLAVALMAVVAVELGIIALRLAKRRRRIDKANDGA